MFTGWLFSHSWNSFAVDPIPRSLSMTVSGAERLQLGRSSGGKTAGQPSDDGCYENGKAWSGAWVDLANAPGPAARIFIFARRFFPGWPPLH